MTQQITTTDAPTLDALAELLNDASEERYLWERRVDGSPEVPRVDELYDVTSLPVYGDHHPSDTTGLYSWDDTRALCIHGSRDDRPWDVCETGDYHA